MVLLKRAKTIANLCARLLIIKFSGRLDAQNESKRAIFDTFKELGGVYIKFLQLLALNVDFLRDWSTQEEYKVFEDVRVDPVNIHEILSSQLGEGYKQEFSYIEEYPFAAGSFAQVYRARLYDGSDVVIKVLRPSLAVNLTADLRILGFLSKLVKLIKPSTMVDITKAYKEFAVVTLAETDYKKEVKSALWFYDYYKNDPNIVIPKTYPQLSSTSIITQEYLGGISLAELLVSQNAGENGAQIISEKLGSSLWQQLESLGDAFVKATIWADQFPGDPHPGNIKLLQNNKVGLIDFGIVAQTPKNKIAYLDFLREYKKLYDDKFDASTFTVAALRFFDEDLANALTVVGKQLGAEGSQGYLEQLGQSATRILEDEIPKTYTQQAFRRKQIMRIFGTVLNTDNRYGIKIDTAPGLTFKVAQQYLQIIGNFSNNGENFVVMSSVLGKAIIGAEQNMEELLMGRNQKPMSVERAVELLSSWFSQIADSDPFLYQQLAAKIGSNGRV